MKGDRSILPRLLLSVFGVFIMLLLAEIGFRLKALYDDCRLQQAWDRMGDVNELPECSTVGLGQMTRISAEPKIIYELIPNLNVTFLDRPVHTDERGFRVTGARGEPATPERTLVGLGDSVMFGWGVADEETYLSLLFRRLSEGSPHGAWRVVNTAVPGYNTVMEIETLKAKGLSLSPSVVLVHFVPNDLDLPNFIRVRSNVFDVHRSFLRDYFSRYHRYRHHGMDRLVDVPFDEEQGRYAAEPDDVPPEYRDLAGRPAFEAALRELGNLASRHDFRIVMLCDPEAPPFVRDLCAELRFDLLETGGAVRRRIRESGARDIVDAGLVLSSKDSHPSAAGHELLTDLLYESLDWGPGSDPEPADDPSAR